MIEHENRERQIGVILLMGLVTKNAILLVDGALQHIREGDPVHEALLKLLSRLLRRRPAPSVPLHTAVAEEIPARAANG